jgi:hypothetical protein
LLFAIDGELEAVIKPLLEAEAVVESKDDSGAAPLSWAAGKDT